MKKKINAFKLSSEVFVGYCLYGAKCCYRGAQNAIKIYHILAADKKEEQEDIKVYDLTGGDTFKDVGQGVN